MMTTHTMKSDIRNFFLFVNIVEVHQFTEKFNGLK